MSLTTRAAASALFCALFVQSLFAGDKPITIALTPDGLSQAERLPLQQYLSQQLGSPVKLVTPETYSTTMDGLSDGSIDFACLGAVNYVRTHAKIGVIPLAQRTIDARLHAVFIAGAGTPIHSLRDLKGKKFAYGDINSTSAHFMPYLEMKEAGLDPDHDMAVRYSGAHPVTVKLVETGIVDAGAVDETVYSSLLNSGKIDTNKVRVFYTTKPFVDYVYVARKEVSEADRDKFVNALLKLRKGENDDVLRILRATKFVKASDDEYSPVRQVAHELKAF
jgi:phosphonate transport system substrate-binding protein